MKEIFKSNRKLVVMFGLFLMVAVLTVITQAINQRTSLKGKAYGSGNLTFVPTETAGSNKTEWAVVVKASTSERVTGALLNITYDKSKISVISSLIDPRFNCMSRAVADQANGTINISGFVTDVCDVQSGVLPSIDANNLPTGEVVFGSFIFRGSATGTVSLGFAGTTEVNGYNPNSADVVIDVTKTPVTVTVNPYGGVVVTPTLSPSTCSDGTFYNQCSTTKPKICENGVLVDRCSSCGCLSGYTCQVSGSCSVTSSTPTPTIRPLTPTPTRVLTPTPTPTIPSVACPNGANGNLNCSADGKISFLDLVIMISPKYWGVSPVPAVAVNRFTPDINPVGGDGVVNVADLTKLLNNWSR